MDYGLKGKTALITGAARGIGKATAEVFAKKGVNIIACDVNLSQLEKTVKELEGYGVSILPVKMDVSSYDDIKEGVQSGIREFGSIDVLLNCAGIVWSSTLIEMDVPSWERVMDVDLKSVFMLSKTVAEHMIEKGIKGRIISISSQASKIGEYANGAYSCAKAAINTLTQVMAQEWGEYGISVNAICPGYVNTEMMEKVFNERGPIEGMTPDEYRKKLCSRIPLGRMAEPEEIGELMAFLASSIGGYITGVAITIAGGSTLI